MPSRLLAPANRRASQTQSAPKPVSMRAVALAGAVPLQTAGIAQESDLQSLPGRVAVMVPMTVHGIGAMVRELGVEPPVQGGDHYGVGCPIGKFGSAVNIAVVDGNLARLCRVKRVQAWHVIAVNVRRAREVAVEKLLPYLLQMRPHELGLDRVGDILCNDALGASRGGFGEDMDCGLEAERHYVLASLGDFGLTLNIGSNGQWGHGRSECNSHADSRFFHERRVQSVEI